MSALFQRTQGNLTHHLELERELEIRDIPFVFQARAHPHPANRGFSATMLSNLFTQPNTNWLYSAILQLTLDGPEPPWSKDGWSFVPLDASSLGRLDALSQKQTNTSSPVPRVNMSLTTPAIRGRINCSPYTVPSNFSTWLKTWDLRNSTQWNMSSNPHGFTTGYQLGADPDNTAGSINGTGFLDTTFLTYPYTIVCCANETGKVPGSTAIGYWSTINSEDYLDQPGPIDIWVKWLRGNAISGIRTADAYKEERVLLSHYERLMFVEVPSITALRCTPVIETVSADVVINPTTGQVASFVILDNPQSVSEAWKHAFAKHNYSHMYIQTHNPATELHNFTSSFGSLFHNALMAAADLDAMGGYGWEYGWELESLHENTFNFRDPSQGLNLDFMTYSMYVQAGKDPDALLNGTVMDSLARRTFSTFFQHFVSNNLSLATGGWAFQPINASLPPDLGPILQTDKNGTSWEKPNPTFVSQTNRTAIAQLSTRTEMLDMNPTAVWLSVSILIWLIGTAVAVAALARRYLRNLDRNVECVGDVLILIAGSDKLLRLVRERESPESKDEKGVMTKLCWFHDVDGKLRWGIEVVESDV